MAFYQGARIYNLFPRLLGPMSNWKDAISRAKTLGFNWVYINPFHYPGFSGSIYSPKDFLSLIRSFWTRNLSSPEWISLKKSLNTPKVCK